MKNPRFLDKPLIARLPFWQRDLATYNLFNAIDRVKLLKCLTGNFFLMFISDATCDFFFFVIFIYLGFVVRVMMALAGLSLVYFSLQFLEKEGLIYKRSFYF